MKCQNCGENDANVRYTQVINGVRKQMNLCEDCAQELGIDDFKFDMISDFSNIWNDMFDIYDDFMPSFNFTQKRRAIGDYTPTANNATAVKDKNSVREDVEKLKSKNIKTKDNKNIKLHVLEEKIKREIQEERYEDAAKTRDEIKKLKNN